MRVNYAIVFVSDMRRSVSFYRDTIGLPLRFESPEWTEFAHARSFQPVSPFRRRLRRRSR